MNIQELLDKYFTDQQERSKGRTRSGKFSPSKFGRCYRLQYWSRKNEPETNPADLNALRRFKAGDLFHEFVQRFLPPHQTEVKVETDDILGFADIVTEDAVVDIKSQHSRAFWYMEKKDAKPISEQKYNNIMQVMTYAYLLGKPQGQLLFISKDDLYTAEYTFNMDVWKDEVEKEINMLKGFWGKSELPPAEPRAYIGSDGKPKDCEYCPFKDKCKEVQDGQAENL